MSEVRKSQKQNPLPGRLEAPLKAKALRFQPRSIMGARETLSRVEKNAQLQGALDSVSRAPVPPSVSFSLDEGRCRHTRDDKFSSFVVVFSAASKATHQSDAKFGPAGQP